MSPVKVQPKILGIILLGKVYVVYVDWGGGVVLFVW
jgi:hypothetical protein